MNPNYTNSPRPISNGTKKERRELKREAKQGEIHATLRRAKLKVYGIVASVIVFLAVAGYFGYRSFSRVAFTPDIGTYFPIEGDKHVTDGTTIEYHTNPPTSGSHYGVPANWGVYDHEIPDEAVVHNLEHGGIWISYKPDLPKASKSKLAEITNSYGKIIMTPREKNDSPIALASWGRMYKPELSAEGVFDEEAVKNFILKYKNTGPEKMPDSAPGKDY